MKKAGGKSDSVFNDGHVLCFEGSPFVTNTAFDYCVHQAIVLNRKGLLINPNGGKVVGQGNARLMPLPNFSVVLFGRDVDLLFLGTGDVFVSYETDYVVLGRVLGRGAVDKYLEKMGRFPFVIRLENQSDFLGHVMLPGK